MCLDKCVQAAIERLLSCQTRISHLEKERRTLLQVHLLSNSNQAQQKNYVGNLGEGEPKLFKLSNELSSGLSDALFGNFASALISLNGNFATPLRYFNKSYA